MTTQGEQQPLIGRSLKLQRVIARARQIARSDVPVIIFGETGVGKELVARAIHYQSRRRGQPFIPVNCSALPDLLLENEMFGHVRGAFTDAKSASQGLVAEANGGSLFLDEIDALSRPSQAKLLRFLQFREYRPLGSPKTHRVDVRLIAATNANLRQLVEAQRFREDLFHRMNIVEISVPPLRERMEDIPMLAHHFLKRYRQESPFMTPFLSDCAIKSLMGYKWPGNVRELEGAIRRALVLAESECIEPDLFDFPPADSQRKEELTFKVAKAKVVDEFEKHYLQDLMRTHDGNVSRASRAAGTPRRCLQRLLRKHGWR